ncbi:Uncharacterised protein [Vibrio cholerae]|nr:Uncharacterised protein [Vibrio cholerae]
MVGWLIEQQHVWLVHHEFAKQHTTLLTTRQYLHGFLDVILAKQHTAQEAANHLLIIAFLTPLTHPLHQVQIFCELVSVVLRIVTNIRVFRPLVHTATWLKYAS